MEFNYTVTERYNDRTLREIMRNEFQMSRIMIKRVKLYGRLEVNGVHMRIIDKVRTGDKVFASYGDDAGMLRKDSGIEIIYEDRYLAVVNKPAGIVTHPTHGHLDDSLITRLSDQTLHPVMRLDRETSGLIVLAKNGYIHNAISSSEIKKIYIAGVYGTFDPPEGIIDLPIKRRPNSVMIRDVSEDGRECMTIYKTLYSCTDRSLVGFRLITGRCHQIRVHSTYMKHPLIGDGLYGPLSNDNPNPSIKEAGTYDPIAGRQLLHAASLTFIHPVSNEHMSFVSHLPGDFRKVFSDVPGEIVDELPGKLDGLFGDITG
ncbi:MAG: RluA family pseudouridine synthase [Clostridiales bacterium]|nr:RluA family pseudouridine synthase [Clostridiales bacterium]